MHGRSLERNLEGDSPDRDVSVYPPPSYATLVPYIDNHYRTIATRGSRGLAGYSMGGYGTIRLAMKYPEVFSSLPFFSSHLSFDQH